MKLEIERKQRPQPEKESGASYWEAFRQDLETYKKKASDGMACRDQLESGYVTRWEEMTKLAPCLLLSTYRKKNGLIFRPQYSSLEKIELSLDDIGKTTVKLPFFVVQDKDLPEKIKDIKTKEYIDIHMHAYTIAFANCLGFFNELQKPDGSSLITPPTLKEPQIFLFLTDEKYRELFHDEPKFWVMSGPIIVTTIRGLSGLKTGFQIKTNAHHEFFNHIGTQQRLKRGRASMLQLETAVLEGMDFVSDQYHPMPSESRYAMIANDFGTIQATKGAIELFRNLPTADELLSGKFTPDRYLLSGMFMQGFYAFVYKKIRELPFEKLDWKLEEIRAGYKDFFQSGAEQDFIKWRTHRGWEEYKKWWDTSPHKDSFLFSVLIEHIGINNMIRVLYSEINPRRLETAVKIEMIRSKLSAKYGFKKTDEFLDTRLIEDDVIDYSAGEKSSMQKDLLGKYWDDVKEEANQVVDDLSDLSSYDRWWGKSLKSSYRVSQK